MKNKRGISMTAQIVLAICALLLIVNIALGLVLFNQSKQAMKTLIDGNMIFISKAAASSVDGDFIRDMTEDDTDAEEYRKVIDALTAFQDNFGINEVDDLECIYIVRQISEKCFIYIIDPDPVDPAYYGQESVLSDAIRSAANGTAAVDEAATEDQWGRFYTAYSPIFDSSGKVAGILGVDFNADWYEAQLGKHGISIALMNVISLFVGALVVLVITNRMRKRFYKLNSELRALSGDVGELANELIPKLSWQSVQNGSQVKEDADASAEMISDPVEQIDKRVRQIRTRVGEYLDFMHQQAYTDLMTGIGNRSAYIERTKLIDKAIDEKKASFALAVFDINALKETNDVFGHDCGDKLIVASAGILKKTFNEDDLFRIGGDEFAVIVEGFDKIAIEDAMEAVERDVKALNGSEAKLELPLSFSKGAAVFDEQKDKDLRSVFNRADEAMYVDKNAFYEIHGDRRHLTFGKPEPARDADTRDQKE